MNTQTKSQTKHKHNNHDATSSHVGAAATELLNEGKKLANEIYEEGLGRVGDAQDQVKEYSDELLLKVKKNPLTSILIAGGIGFVLSALLRK